MVLPPRSLTLLHEVNMHEYGIAQEMVSVALRQAQENQAHRITHFRIEMSDVADESEDSLRFYLENLTRGTVANEAKFEYSTRTDPDALLEMRQRI